MPGFLQHHISFLPSLHLRPLCQPLMSCSLFSPPFSVISPSPQLKLRPSHQAHFPPELPICVPQPASPHQKKWAQRRLAATYPPAEESWFALGHAMSNPAPVPALSWAFLPPPPLVWACFWLSLTLSKVISCFHTHFPNKIPPWGTFKVHNARKSYGNTMPLDQQ